MHRGAAARHRTFVAFGARQRGNPANVEDRERREEDAAAAEAGAIGGESGQEERDPAERPVAEGGGGEAEGFEEAEEALIESAQHGEEVDPTTQAGAPEAEAERAGASYGEPDEEDVTEVVRDPEEGPDDPGEGPGIASER
jgi:hypothetical protein